MDQVTNNVRHNNWIAMIQDQKQSGLTVSAWCKQANISTNCFYYRQQKLREVAASAIPQLVEINASELATRLLKTLLLRVFANPSTVISVRTHFLE